MNDCQFLGLVMLAIIIIAYSAVSIHIRREEKRKEKLIKSFKTNQKVYEIT